MSLNVRKIKSFMTEVAIIKKPVIYLCVSIRSNYNFCTYWNILILSYLYENIPSLLFHSLVNGMGEKFEQKSKKVGEAPT